MIITLTPVHAKALTHALEALSEMDEDILSTTPFALTADEISHQVREVAAANFIRGVLTSFASSGNDELAISVDDGEVNMLVRACEMITIMLEESINCGEQDEGDWERFIALTQLEGKLKL